MRSRFCVTLNKKVMMSEEPSSTQKNPAMPPVQTFKVSRPEDQNRKEPLKDAKAYFKWGSVTKSSPQMNQDEMALLSEGRKEMDNPPKKKKCTVM